jgi:hypothetical protein
MSLEQTIKDTLLSESVDLDARLQQLVRAGLMPANTIPVLRKAIAKVQGGMVLQGAERDVMANFLNSMMFIVLGDDAIFNKARVNAKSVPHHPYIQYATEETEVVEGENKEMKGKDPCWKGYEMVGTKKKGGREVPNCVPANEEVENLDELSRATVGRYSMKAKSIADNEGGKDRTKGRELAGRKKWGGTMSGVKKAKVMATEEAEQIDELSKKTLASYINKSTQNAVARGIDYGYSKDSKDSANALKKLPNRVQGIKKATDKLTKESRRAEALADIASVTQMNESYRTTFNAALEQFNIKSPSELDEEKRKEFFNFVDQNYKKGDN